MDAWVTADKIVRTTLSTSLLRKLAYRQRCLIVIYFDRGGGNFLRHGSLGKNKNLQNLLVSSDTVVRVFINIFRTVG